MNLYLGLPLVQALFSLVLLIIVLRTRTQDTARHVFALYLGGLLAWGILIYLMRSSPDLGTAYFWEKIILPLGLLLSVILYHFSVNFTGYRKNKLVAISGYALCALFLILSEFGLVVGGMQIRSYGYAPVPGPLFLPLVIISNSLVIAAMINLWKYSRVALYKDERNRSLYIMVGMIISAVGGALDVLPLLGLSLYPGLIFGNLIFCIITTIAIMKYRLLGIHIIVRKGTTYLVSSAAIAAPFLIILFVFEGVLRTDLPNWTLFLLIPFMAIVLQPIWRFAQSSVDKLFFLSRYDFLKALDDFSRKNHRITNINYLGNALVKLTERALQSSMVHLYLISEKGDFSLVSSARGSAENINALCHNPVMAWISSHRVVLRREELAYISRLQSLTTGEQNELNSTNAELFVPVLDKEEDLIGVIVLGPKLNNKPYSDEDEQIILTVTQRLALELENARLYSQEIIMRKEVQNQDNMKTEFLNSAAHELKTPLTAIISSSEIMAEKLSLTEDELGKELVNNIHRSAEVMNRRVSELLDLARVQAGSLQMSKQLLDINLIVIEVASQLSPLFTSRQQKLGLEVQDVPVALADRDKLEQVFVNLLSNANKYSPSHGDVIIRTKQDQSNILVEVQDSAPIITEEEKLKLFTPYYRGENSSERLRIPGLGLGLAISKKIIEMHGGKIWVDCCPGKGNVFTFSLAAST